MSEVTPDADLTDIQALHQEVHDLRELVGQLVASHNQVGENVAWLVANTQGIFQMFNSPEMMNQMMGMVLGGGNAPGRTSGPTEGADS